MRLRLGVIWWSGILIGSLIGRNNATFARGASMGGSALVTDSKFPDLPKPHPCSAHDLVSMQRIGDATPSADGNWIAFTRRTWDPAANKATTNLWLVSMDGKVMRPLTTAKQVADSSPA